MRIRVFPSDRDAAAALAHEIAAAIRAKPDLVLGLPTGRTPVLLYRELAALEKRGEADFARVTTFTLDEFLGLGSDHPGSYRQYMQRHLFGKIHVAPERTHFLNGAAPDPPAECERYEAAIEAAGGIDLQILGLGTNGHIGFNEPGDTLVARTHRVTLRPETRRANASLFDGHGDAVPHEALSMGMATILHARAIILLATGRGKAACVEGMVHGPLTPRLPASFLQTPREVEVFLDEAAAERLRKEKPFTSSSNFQ